MRDGIKKQLVLLDAPRVAVALRERLRELEREIAKVKKQIAEYEAKRE